MKPGKPASGDAEPGWPPLDAAAASASAGTRPRTRWRIVLAYDGACFQGWQSQPSGLAVQDFLEKRLAEIAGGFVRAHSAGRTDRGVHAEGQVVHFDLAWAHRPEQLLRALRTGLPAGMLVRSVARARPDFHARYDATGKRYVYRLHRGPALPLVARSCWELPDHPLDIDAMRAGAARLVGRHDFRSFAATPAGGQIEDTVKDVWRIDLRQRGRLTTLVFEGSGFLYKMVRSLTGALVALGNGKLTFDTLDRLLAGAPRKNLYLTAPSQGLTLQKVFYGPRRRR